MRFTSTYKSANGTKLPAYYRTIDADSEHEANKIAKQYCRKGYLVARLNQQIGKE